MDEFDKNTQSSDRLMELVYCAFTLPILKFSKERGPWNKTYNSENRKNIDLCVANICNVVR